MECRAIILEDDDRAAQAIAERIIGSPFASSINVRRVATADELARLMEAEGTPDILFADIKLEGETNGIRAVQSLFSSKDNVQVIYITGFPEYCVSVYETDHVYFLLKPVDQETFNKALSRAIDNLQARAKQTLPIAYKGHTTFVAVEDIEYVESKLRKVVIKTDADEFEMYATVADTVKALPESFVQVHKSFVVNLDAVTRIDSAQIVMRSGCTVPIGQRYKEAMKQRMAEHFGI